ncbi:methylthioribulose 1-phosphate dehydratase [Fictibacillus terranigra]|uniref:Methylthioribulose-1-phosphate dehydratase n=1 Tax=Fictibacillus terranigra TaxID=3058424 RepID=A0ABT8E4L0_9BACL|nr:methylthioribulose 1-phosphate dehydratase [Fictibacillus sp. CENA-BCM004]MDN4072819.1 methylthioribulose 1-phosphate dehydratase [Fictibacillus sp. CENA-BCM004]
MDTLKNVTLEDIQASFSLLREMKKTFATRGWFPATSGNLSIRVRPGLEIFAITSSGKDKSMDTPEDFLIIDVQGKPLTTTALKPSAETLIHTAVYESIPDCEAVFHVHTVPNNLISELYGDEGEVIFKGQELIKAFDLWEQDASISIPIVENFADIPKLAAEIKKSLKFEVPGVLIRNHGIYVWGDSDFSAKRHLEAFEFLFNYHIRLLSIQRKV